MVDTAITWSGSVAWRMPRKNPSRHTVGRLSITGVKTSPRPGRVATTSYVFAAVPNSLPSQPRPRSTRHTPAGTSPPRPRDTRAPGCVSPRVRIHIHGATAHTRRHELDDDQAMRGDPGGWNDPAAGRRRLGLPRPGTHRRGRIRGVVRLRG